VRGLALSESKLSSVPRCRTCGEPLVLVDGDEQRWYCYTDDEVYWAREQRWLGEPPPKQEIQPVLREYGADTGIDSKGVAKPLCRQCNTPISLVDEEERRWYCYKDDQLYYEKEQRWGKRVNIADILERRRMIANIIATQEPQLTKGDRRPHYIGLGVYILGLICNLVLISNPKFEYLYVHGAGFVAVTGGAVALVIGDWLWRRTRVPIPNSKN